MRRLILSVALLTLLLSTATTALAHPNHKHQENKDPTGDAAEPADGSPRPAPPDYEFLEDGTVVIGGDVSGDCPSFARSFEQGLVPDKNLGQARRVLEQCGEAGFLPAALLSAVASGEDELADTGGPDLLLLLAVPSAVLMASGLLLIRKLAR